MLRFILILGGVDILIMLVLWLLLEYGTGLGR
jgi:hypothetical protein